MHETAVPAQDRARGDQAMARRIGGSRWMRAAKTARPAQSRRGVGLVRRSTAISWRNTRRMQGFRKWLRSTDVDETLKPAGWARPSLPAR